MNVYNVIREKDEKIESLERKIEDLRVSRRVLMNLLQQTEKEKQDLLSQFKKSRHLYNLK